MSAGQFVVRHCHGLAEFERCVQLQLDVWGGEPIDAVPLPVFVITADEMGGQVLGAFDGDLMIGFTLAMPGFHGLSPHLHSHMTAVLTAYRDKGVGRQLKLFQREDALSRGIKLVEWTFDPLELRNAHFNLVRLGAIVRRFLPNHYGVTTSPLHGGLPTDRLLAEWWLDSQHARACIEGKTTEVAGTTSRRSEIKKIYVPANINDLKSAGHSDAVAIQTRVRKEFQEWLGQRYAVTGLEKTREGANYLLEPYASAKDLSS